ncbi:MAG: SRPBCC family protein [Desulfobacterium sp.]|nr:SRPBCC family protein [Desulfobacterium sp.]
MGQTKRMFSWLDQWLRYRFEEKWRVEASAEKVWDTIIHVDGWPDWWKGLEVSHSVDDLPVVMAGKQYRTRWKGPLPYRLEIHAVVREARPQTSISADVHGDIQGHCTCRIQENQHGTQVFFSLDVRTATPWMTLLSPFLKGYFRENHNRLMARGMQGFTQHLAKEATP